MGVAPAEMFDVFNIQFNNLSSIIASLIMLCSVIVTDCCICVLRWSDDSSWLG